MRDILHYTLRLLRRRTLRTTLTVLQVALGVWAISLVLTANFNIHARIHEATRLYAQDHFEVTVGMESEDDDGTIVRRLRAAFQVDHLQTVRESPHVREAYIVDNLGFGYTLPHDGQTYRLQGLVGATAHFQHAAGIELVDGSFFTEADVAQGNRVIVISESVAAQLFPGERAVGKQLHFSSALGGRVVARGGRVDFQRDTLTYDVIGVMKDMDELKTVFVELAHAIVPLGSNESAGIGVDLGQRVGQLRQFAAAPPGGSAGGSAGGFVGGFVGGAAGGDVSGNAQGPQMAGPAGPVMQFVGPGGLQQIGSALTSTYRTIVVEAEPGRLHQAADDVRVLLQPLLQPGEDVLVNYVKDRDQQLFESVRRVIRFFGAFGFIAVIISGVGVLSLMLVSVVERTRETGLRRALGASKRWIWMQFLGESSVLSTLGAVVGLGMAWLTAPYVLEELLLKAFWEDLIPFKGVLNATAIALSLAVTLGAGILAGLYPAREAAAIAPVDALRDG